MTRTTQPQLSKGDHIRVWRGGYYHHGIYCGDSSVIHYGGGKGDSTIQRESLEAFALEKTIEIASYSKYFSASEVIERAESRLGEGKYNLVFNNCEHFANWCKIGQARSGQVDVVFHTVGKMITPLILNLAPDIIRFVLDEEAKNPRNVPQQALILFQRFKEAYESKDIEELADTVSNDFRGDIYGKRKSDFVAFMRCNLERLKYGTGPHLRIEIHNISSNSDEDFSAVIKMNATIKILGVPTPLQWDGGKLFCKVEPEGKYRYWRITKLEKFED
ncbi:MAG: lecithin retinol acyltransferase family protein [Leptolyngbyaceae cyanobacterium bins.302]|nr:lecithin retinol acyltransferase family protein [Leptolyngbyaceae cyanobacterium bins.302]